MMPSLSDWPLYVKTGDSVYSAKLEIGDAVLYSGTKDLHWRDQMPDNLNNVLGVFFHYVQKNFSGSLD